MKCLIVDDEHLARKVLETYISRMPDLELVGTCENALAAMQTLRQHAVDLMFLDIHMPDLTGLELIRSLRRPPQVILATAYSEHALESYELNVVDYLLKPVSFERFVQAVNKAQPLPPAQAAAIPSPSLPTQADHLFVKVDYEWLRIDYQDILYVEGMREYVNIQTAARRHIVYQSLKKMVELLPDQQFMRVHKSYIVSLPSISRIYGHTIVV
ncbi:MAG: LytTR family DNA-binding domain-containing protein, partial [Bacteroidota bacterium]